MAWTYEQRTGAMYRPNGRLINIGYAGTGPGRNNPAMQHVSNVGPLPAGKYRIGKAIRHAKLGTYAIPLTPDPANEMFGRSAFYIHANNLKNDASHGCIIQSLTSRQEIAASPDRELIVVPGPEPNTEVPKAA